MRKRIKAVLAATAAIALVSMLAACTGGASDPVSTGSSKTELKVGMVNLTWASLSPPPNPASPNFVVNYMDAIYGELFQRNSAGQVVPDLATGYKYSSDGKTITITVRKNVKFTDGTPFTAQAVADQFTRSLLPANACSCLGSFTSVSSVTVDGNDVLLHLSQPDATIMQSIIGLQPNWVPSPTAVKAQTDAAFGVKPVGAGPYKVVSNTPGSSMTLEANPDYWNGAPKIKTLTFTNLTDDQSAYAALQAGSVDMVMGMTNAAILTQAKSAGTLQLSSVPGVTPYQFLFNTKRAPFNNILARQAVAYATDPKVLLQASSPGFGTIVQGTTGPSGLFYEAKVPGTLGYDLAKAKAAVAQLGGLSVTFNYPTNSTVYTNGAQAVSSMLTAAGIKVTLNPTLPAQSAANNKSGDWQTQFTSVGGIDPSIGLTGFANRYGSAGSLSGTADPTLDAMILKATTTIGNADRKPIIDDIQKYINSKVLSVNLFAVPTVIVAVKDLTGIKAAPNGTSGKEMVHWEDVAFK